MSFAVKITTNYVVFILIAEVCSLPVKLANTNAGLSRGVRSLIVNGDRSNARNFFVRIQLPSFNGGAERGRFCGGALVNEYWVVTAAHCVVDITDPQLAFVEVGDFVAAEVFTIHEVDKWVIHEKFNRSDKPSYDIAMVKLEEPVTDDTKIVSLCKDLQPNGVISGSCGMGAISRSRDNPRFPEALMETYFFLEFTPWDPFSLPPIFAPDVVAVDNLSEGSNMCDQDDGSPLYTFYCQSLLPECLYGIMSYSIDKPDSPPDEHCNGKDYFASIPAVHEWIEAAIVLDFGLNIP